jgi:hypothetical protein
VALHLIENNWFAMRIIIKAQVNVNLIAYIVIIAGIFYTQEVWRGLLIQELSTKKVSKFVDIRVFC